MQIPEMPADESLRASALDALNLVYTPAEERFDRITRVASRLFEVPIVLISLITADKQWFKSRQGLDLQETPRTISFCAHAILSDDVFIVSNAIKDPDFRDNPLVTGPPGIRFYAGQPLLVDSHRIGTLCLIDNTPKHLKPAEYDSLRSLAKWVELEISDWRQSKQQFIRHALHLDDRENLLDPVTGNLNDLGIAKLEQHLAERQIAACNLQVEIERPDQDYGSDAFLRERSDIAACLRTTLNDTGIIGFEEPNKFAIYLPESELGNVEALAMRVQESLLNLQNAHRNIRALRLQVTNPQRP